MSEKNDEKTSVDLGLDLLEGPTQIFPGSQPPPAEELKPDPVRLEEEVKSAEILASEGLGEEAKRKLRAILRVDPESVHARDALDRILKAELDRILSDLKSSTPPSAAVSSGGTETPESLEDSWMDHFNLSEHTEELSVLGEHQGLDEFLVGLDRDLASVEDRDRVDLGIGFLEMGMPRVALHLFERAHGEREQCLSLRAQAHIRLDRAVDAVILLEEGLHDVEIPENYKRDYLYWMGRAQEKLKQPSHALAAYRRLAQVDPQYRDVRDRVRKLQGTLV